jgi:DNA polymerase III subunit gamma/tau
MGQALYRKYRSKNLAEIVGQEPITRALDRALSGGHISHAYLFTGPRGVGKTSIARILAHEVNKLPYDETTTHMDIIEIDAASNRRIDEIRDLRDKVHVAPTSAAYKVYIVDEVHMLTKEAFNALLKTLEEPPAHVIFILATTEIHKLPETIVSRTQHYAFKPVALPQVVKHLGDIAKEEKLTIDTAALELIAEHGQGSFRDSISLLDQVRNYGDTITRTDVEAVLGVAPEAAIQAIIAAIAGHDAPGVVTQLRDIKNQGVDTASVAKQLGLALRESLLANTSQLDGQVSISLQKDLLQVPASLEPSIALELCILQHTVGTQQAAQTVAATPTKPKAAAAAVSPTPAKIEKPVVVETKKPAAKAKPEVEEITKETTPTAEPETAAPTTGSFTIETWPEVLGHIKKTYNTMYGVLRMAEATFDANELTLSFKFGFHQKRMNDPKNKAIIIDTIKQLSGSAVEVSCIVNEDAKPQKDANPAPAADLGTISNIFGGAELLES